MLESVQQSHGFQEGTWGAEIYTGLEPKPENGDTVISKHWNQRLVVEWYIMKLDIIPNKHRCSSFKNTDLDWLLLPEGHYSFSICWASS